MKRIVVQLDPKVYENDHFVEVRNVGHVDFSEPDQHSHCSGTTKTEQELKHSSLSTHLNLLEMSEIRVHLKWKF